MSVVLTKDTDNRFMVYVDGELLTHRRNETKARRDAELYAGGGKYKDETESRSKKSKKS